MFRFIADDSSCLRRRAASRVFVDFEGVMTASTVWINGKSLGEYKGGYTPFSFELTPHLDFDGENLLAVDVDSTERADIPPFGYQIDYLTFGGIYREVALRIVPATFIENIFARSKRCVERSHPSLDVDCFPPTLRAPQAMLDRLGSGAAGRREANWRRQSKLFPPAAQRRTIRRRHTLQFRSTAAEVRLWDLIASIALYGSRAPAAKRSSHR